MTISTNTVNAHIQILSKKIVFDTTENEPSKTIFLFLLIIHPSGIMKIMCKYPKGCICFLPTNVRFAVRYFLTARRPRPTAWKEKILSMHLRISKNRSQGERQKKWIRKSPDGSESFPSQALTAGRQQRCKNKDSFVPASTWSP